MIQILAPEKDRKTNIGIPCSSCRENPSVVRMRIGDEREATSIRLCVDCRDDLLLGLIRNKDSVTTMDENHISEVGKKVRCDWCNGQGYTNTAILGFYREVCPVCNGNGIVVVKDGDNND